MSYKWGMKSLYAFSIRTLVLGLAALLLFSVGLIIYTSDLLRDHKIADAKSLAESAAIQVYNDQTLLLAGLEQLATTISFFPAVQNHNRSGLEHILSPLVAANSKITNIIIADTNGSVWASALPFTPPLSVGDRRYFKNALARGIFSSGDFMEGQITKKPVLGFAYPVKSTSGLISDVIIITVPLDMYGNLYPENMASPVSSILLVDYKGTILFSSVDRALVGKQDKPELFAKMSTTGDSGSFEAAGNLGIERLFSYRALRLKHENTPYLYIRTGIDKRYIIRDSYVEAAYMVAALITMLLASIGIALYISRKSVFTNLTIIQDAATKTLQGDYKRRVSDNKIPGLFDGISHVFDEMAENLAQNKISLQHSNDALSQSEKKYRELVEKANAIILKMDRSGRITFFNEYAENFFGFSEQELLGRSVVGTIVPETESSGRDLQGMIVQLIGNPSHFAKNINENMRKNGERVWISWSNQALVGPDATYQGVLSVGHDITEQKRMEEVLRASEQRFRSFVENANDVVFVLTPDGTFSYVSPQWSEAFGYEISETVGKPFVPFVHPDDVPACADFLATVLSTGEKHRGVEYRVHCKDGTWKSYTANGARIIDQDGSPLFIGIGRDITEQKLVQNELMKAQKLESISSLAAGIAHNFNNVLTGVIGYISFARKHLEERDKVLPLLEAAEKSSYRAAGLARQLLTFSKGGVPFMSLVSPEKLVQESLSLFLSGTKIKGIVHAGSTQTVSVDCDQINQAFNNIILNSIHSMPNGGTLTVNIEDIRLEKKNVYLLNPGWYVKIVFADSGIGIEKEHLAKVFDPYFTTRSEGTGLGLSITQSIIAKHSGNIDVVSEVDQGTVVTVILPSYREMSADNVGVTGKTEPFDTVIPVLIMDDREDIRELLSLSLSDLGYQVQTCSTGEEAVEIYKKCWLEGRTLPVVVLDLLVPGGMGGKEAAKRILSVDQHARLIVSSGYPDDPIMTEYKKNGFCAALAKPYTTDTLVQVINQVSRVP